MKKIFLTLSATIAIVFGIAQSNQKTVVYLKNFTKVETLSSLVDSLSFVEQKGALKNRGVILNQMNNRKTLFSISNVDSIRALEPSGTVITQSIADLTLTSVTCTGIVKLDEGSTISACGFVWSNSKNPTLENNVGKTENSIQSERFTSTLSGLTSGIEYYVKAYAIVNAINYYGNEINFYPGTLPTVITNALSGIYSTTAIGGSTTENGGSPITASGLVWGKSQNPGIQFNEGMTINGNGSSTTIDYLSNMTPLSTYYVRAYASNYFGTSYGNTLSFNTNSDPDITNNISTRSEMKVVYDQLYNQLKSDGIEGWALDLFVYTETHADNAYRGSTDIELTQLEQQNQDRYNYFFNRDWDYFYKWIRVANKIICNIDLVSDPALTPAERKQWKSEALILRSMIYFDMVRLWGPIPLVITEVPIVAFTNIPPVNHLYLPKRDSVITVYKQIIKDLNFALGTDCAPVIDPANKFKFSRTVAYALLAKIYAEKPVRDYSKVIQYSTEVQKDVTLVPNFGDLFDMNFTNTDVKNRNTTESIFEINCSEGGNWLTWMYGIDASDPTSKYDWAKWCTPSRDLLAAFDADGDVIRKNQTITTADASWNNHYPSKGYPFMYKYRSKFNSIIKLRLADILLLKAEAFVEQGNFVEAASLVNTIRIRAKLSVLDGATVNDKELMKAAVLNERRLELAFEGQRWFDLVRTGKVFDTMNTLNSRDAGRMSMYPITADKCVFPVPQLQIDQNPLLVQNPGYDGNPVYPISKPAFDRAEVTQSLINYGDPIDLHVTVSDPVTPLLIVKVNVLINNQVVITENVNTSGNKFSFDRNYRIPLVKQAKGNTDIKISLTSTNLEGYSKDTVFSSTKVNRLPMPDLYLVPDLITGKTIKLDLINTDSLIYRASNFLFSNTFDYKLTTKINSFGKIDWAGMVFGKIGDGIGLIDQTGESIHVSDETLLDISSLTFDAMNLTAKVSGKKHEAVNKLDINIDLSALVMSTVNFRGGSVNFGENVEVTFTGIPTDLINSLSPDYFEITGAHTAKFLGKSGLYKAYFLTASNYLYIEPLPDVQTPEVLWICGTGFGRPQLPYTCTSSWNWNSPLDYAPCRLVSPGIYQVTIYCKNDQSFDETGTLNFKFFHQRGWVNENGEELATNYTISSPFSSSNVFPYNGDVIGLSSLPFEGVYQITLNQNDMTIKAVKLK